MINHNSIPSACYNGGIFSPVLSILLHTQMCQSWTSESLPLRPVPAPHIRRSRICPLLCQQILGQHGSAPWRTTSPVDSYDTQMDN